MHERCFTILFNQTNKWTNALLTVLTVLEIFPNRVHGALAGRKWEHSIRYKYFVIVWYKLSFSQDGPAYPAKVHVQGGVY